MLGIEAPDAGGQVALDGHDRLAGRHGRPHRPTSKRRCRWCSRTPTRRSTAAGRCGASSVVRSASSPGCQGEGRRQRVDELAEHLRLTPRHLDLKPRQLSGRAQAARRDRPRVRRRSADRGVRRADERARRVGAGRDPQPARRAAGARARPATCSSPTTSGVVRYLADRIAVMYLGRIQEVGRHRDIFNGPNHPYTEALLSAVPSVDGERARRGSGSTARSRARPTRRAAACSTPAARGSSPACAR